MNTVDFIICEDVRPELHGKLSLLGVFGEEMQLMGVSEPLAMPVAVRLAVYLCIPRGEGRLPDTWDLLVTLDREKILEGPGNPVEVKNPALPLMVVANMPNIVLPRLGILTFSAVFRSGDEIVHNLTKSLRVTVGAKST